MLLDTGAYFAAVDNRFRRAIRARPIVTRAGHLRPDEFEHVERIDAHRAEVRALVDNAPVTPLRSFTVESVPVRAPDIRVRNLELGDPELMGVIGMDILGTNGAIIDFGGRKLYVLPAR